MHHTSIACAASDSRARCDEICGPDYRRGYLADRPKARSLGIGSRPTNLTSC